MADEKKIPVDREKVEQIIEVMREALQADGGDLEADRHR